VREGFLQVTEGDWIDYDDVHAQIEFANRMVTGLVSLAVIVAAVGGSIVASLWLTRGRAQPRVGGEPREEAE